MPEKCTNIGLKQIGGALIFGVEVSGYPNHSDGALGEQRILDRRSPRETGCPSFEGRVGFKQHKRGLKWIESTKMV